MSKVISKLETSQRLDLIRELMKYDLKHFAEVPHSEVETWIGHVLLNGFKGFNNMSDSELKECLSEVEWQTKNITNGEHYGS